MAKSNKPGCADNAPVKPNIGDNRPPAGRGISMERWQQAQNAERKLHTLGLEEGINHYQKTYQHYFAFVQLGFDLGGLSVMEVGPADFPALRYCKNYAGIVIEPMPSEHLQQFCKDAGVILFESPMENIDENMEGLQAIQKSGSVWLADEIWLFNVMQHIIDPQAFVAKCKSLARRIRFFEPINYPTSEYHPHTYTMEDFRNWFGDCVKEYKGGSVAGFHESDCAYGVFIQQ